MTRYINGIKDWHNYVKKSRYKCCLDCIFVGENNNVSPGNRLCAETMSAIPEVGIGFGCCDRYKSMFIWYNRINPIKKRLLEKEGFNFKNR